MTLRSEGQFNTVVYEEEDLYRGNTQARRRDDGRATMPSASASARGTASRSQTEAGSLEAVVALVDIRPGNLAMYYPEANALVPRRIDERLRHAGLQVGPGSRRARVDRQSGFR